VSHKPVAMVTGVIHVCCACYKSISFQLSLWVLEGHNLVSEY